LLPQLPSLPYRNTVTNLSKDEDEDEADEPSPDSTFVPVKTKTPEKKSKKQPVKRKRVHPKDVNSNTYVFAEDIELRVR
jgi:hypothetical protein